MAGDSIGTLFRVTNWGESHGAGIGVVVEGTPPGLHLSEALIQKDLDARRPGQSRFTTSRDEPDRVKILSGLSDGKTTGTPLLLMIENQDQRPKDYQNLTHVFRPSHADFAYTAKYGLREKSGGGRSSARLTAGSVAAGAVAKCILHEAFKIEFLAYVKTVSNILSPLSSTDVTPEAVQANPIRTTDPATAEKMMKLIDEAREKGDSLGGTIECRITNVPAGLGEPLYDKLEADLAKAMLGINACKGFEIGSGFSGTQLKGSEHNDLFKEENGKVITTTNRSGGVQGGISNGMPILFSTAFKPTATILREQTTLNEKKESVTLTAKGRHDPCVLPRAVPIVEAMAAIVLADHFLRHRGQVGHFTAL